ncbi:MAG: hypothetical protein RI957_754 [Verrucomicrobiota bacterium]
MAKKPTNQYAPRRSYRAVFWVLGLLVAVMAAWAVHRYRETLAMHWYRTTGTLPSAEKERAPAPDAAKWNLLRQDIQRWRKHYAESYRTASTPREKKAVIDQARDLLEHSLPEMMRCWLGTPWDFNGTATTPGEGKIACGYFVTTVLEAAEFRIDRSQLAQQASQQILRTFLPMEDLRIRVGIPYKTFRFETTRGQPGIYLIGLDTHIGFVVVKDQEFRFIHSSGSQPWCVVDESSELALVLARSNYRVLGNISANDEVIRRWLMGEKFPTQR